MRKSIVIPVSLALFATASYAFALSPQKTTQGSGRDGIAIQAKALGDQLRKVGHIPIFVSKETYAPSDPKKTQQIRTLARALTSMGEPAVPIMVQVIQDATLYADVRIQMVTGLGEIASFQAVLQLIGLLSDFELGVFAVDALVLIGEPAVRDLTRTLDELMARHRVTNERAARQGMIHVVRTLGRIGGSAQKAIPLLQEILQDFRWDTEVGEETTIALGRLGCNEPQIIASLTDWYRTESDERSGIALAIALAGVAGQLAEDLTEEVLQFLLSHSGDPANDASVSNARERAEIIHAIDLLQPASLPGTQLEVLLANLEDLKRSRRLSALRGLGDMKERARVAIPELIKMISHAPDHETRSAALQALSQIAPEGVTDQVKKKYYIAESQDSSVPLEDRLSAIHELGELGKEVVQAEELLELLSQPNSVDVERGIVNVLRKNYTPVERLSLLQRCLNYQFVVSYGFEIFIRETFSDILLLAQIGEQTLTSAL